MSLVHHLATGTLSPGLEEARILYKCTGCGACSSFCRHGVDVAGVLQEARVAMVAQGLQPFAPPLFERPDVPLDSEPFKRAVATQRYHDHPAVLLFPGHDVLLKAPKLLGELWRLLGHLEDHQLALGTCSTMDSGYHLWTAGFEAAFLAQAHRVAASLRGARDVVVLSPQDLVMFSEVYPSVGIELNASFLDLATYLLPILAGGAVVRKKGVVGYFDSCLLARKCGGVDAPRELLTRVTMSPVSDLALCQDATDCCGASGAFAQTDPASALESARRILVQAEERGIERLFSFSPECVLLLQKVGNPRVSVEHGLSLVNSAVRRS